jgi:RNA polymerase sigma-70 factor, ECF subfamily
MAAGTSPDELYQRVEAEYATSLDRLAYAYECDPEKRRDLLQEIHLQLWRSFENFDARCSLRTWIYRVAHNVAASHVVRETRMKRNAPPLLSLDDAEAQLGHENVEASADRSLARNRLLALIQRLDLVDRQVILAYLEDMDAESIAEFTGLTTANVWTRIHRIKNVLIRQFHAGGRHAG